MSSFHLISPEADLNLLPQRATPNSAAYDLKCGKDYVIYPNQLIRISTGISVSLEPNHFLLIRLRSSTAASGLIMMSSGVVDSDYNQEILVTVQNLSDNLINLRQGDRVAQGIILEYLTASDSYEQENPPIHKNRVGGHGSTGR